MRYAMRKAGVCVAAVLMVLGATTVCPAPALLPTVTLSDDNSTAEFVFPDADVQAANADQRGQISWTVDGVNHLAQQWFWISIDGAAEQSLDNYDLIDDSVFVDPATPPHSSLLATYDVDGVEVELLYNLDGGAIGSNTSDLNEAISITNNTEGSIEVSFFQYVNFDLGGTPGDDSAAMQNAFTVQQTDGSGLAVQETITNPESVRHELGVFSSIRDVLDDANADDLPHTATNLSPLVSNKDVTWAFQWDFTIGAGQSETILKDKLIHEIPLPSSLLMLGAAGLGLLRRRRV